MIRVLLFALAAAFAPHVAAQSSDEALRAEIVFWETVRASNEAADYRAYLEQYPNGKFAVLARNRLASLTAKPAPAQAPAPVKASASPMPQSGDTWTYRLIEPRRTDGPKQRRYTVTVTSANGLSVVEQTELEGAASGTSTHDAGVYLAPVEASVFSPYLEVLRPAPGGGRRFRVEMRDRACTGQYACRAEGQVMGREPVKVPAGAFDAIKIYIEQSWSAAQLGAHPAQAASFNGSRRLFVWYVPELKRAVKYQSRPVFGDAPPMEPYFDLELESYKLQ
jgi:hypothetical protein